MHACVASEVSEVQAGQGTHVRRHAVRIVRTVCSVPAKCYNVAHGALPPHPHAYMATVARRLKKKLHDKRHQLQGEGRVESDTRNKAASAVQVPPLVSL